MATPTFASSRPSRIILPTAIAVRRIAIVGPTGSSLLQLRGGLMAALTAQRHQVICFARTFEPIDEAVLSSRGITHHLLGEAQQGLPLFAERRAIQALAREFEAWRPHIVLAYGSDTTLTAVKAARTAKVERIVAIINSLPQEPVSTKSLRGVGRTLELVDAAVFHNSDHPKVLQSLGLLPRDLSFVVVPGPGVDLVHDAVQPLPSVADGLVFLMIARLDRAKGVLDYCNAARVLKARAPSARFTLFGPLGSGISAVTPKTLASYADCVDYLGPLDDARAALGGCHVYVYPSHTEGMPVSILAALAAGRPVITTDGPGCRETVDVRVNGVLVPKGDPDALAIAMESFLKRPDLIPAMARASRAKAERRFDQAAVNAILFGVLGL